MNTYDADGLTYHKGTDKTISSVMDEVYDDLCPIIQQDLSEAVVRDTLESIANIYQGNEPMAEKYGLIADLLDEIVEREALNKWDDLIGGEK